MVGNISYIESKTTNPYHNLAMEEQLFLSCEMDECILYLWQNEHTVVVGRNQNIWKECLVSRMEEEHVHPVRRLSGGGAVYHDSGNLNFTFLVRKDNYDVDRQLKVILTAVRKLGIHAEKSGRNDLLIDGHKFSGNAFYKKGDRCYHHGTLMVDVDLGDLSRYLTVSKEKLRSKGVDSVKARVVNLKEYAPDLTIELLKEKLLEAFEEVYGWKAKVRQEEELDEKSISEGMARFSSWDWIFGRTFDFQYELAKRFDWGQITLQFQVKNGRIRDTNIFSDSMKPEFVEGLLGCFKGIRYDRLEICEKLSRCFTEDREEEQLLSDMAAWMKIVEL